LSICIAILIEFLNGNVYFGWSWALGFGGLIADFSTASALATTDILLECAIPRKAAPFSRPDGALFFTWSVSKELESCT
jgi:hypothetical protein